MRALGGWAIGESVRHLPVENQPQPLEVSCRLVSAKGNSSQRITQLCALSAQAWVQTGRVASSPLIHGKCCSGHRVTLCLPVTPLVFLNQLLSMLQPDLFFTSFFQRGHCAHSCILLFGDLSPEEGPLFLDKLDILAGVFVLC